jgi:hypothetical protein
MRSSTIERRLEAAIYEMVHQNKRSVTNRGQEGRRHAKRATAAAGAARGERRSVSVFDARQPHAAARIFWWKRRGLGKGQGNS